MRRWPAAAAAALVCVLAATACGVPTQSAPSSIAPSRVPFGLLDSHPSTTTTTQPKVSSYVQVQVFFLGASNQLQAENRFVAAPAPLLSVLTALMAGPSKADEANGVTTAIPNDVTVLSVTTAKGGTVTVNLNAAFGLITGIDVELAVAQVVSTVAAQNGPDTGVIFEIEGQRTSVPVANGSLQPGPVYLIQFQYSAS